MAASRVLMIGVDAMEHSLMREGIRDGWLPTFKALLEGGAIVPLRSTMAIPGAAWPTTVTGTPLQEHLAMFDRQLAPGSYDIEDLPAEGIRRPPFWRYVSDAGLRSTISSIYGAGLIAPFRGTQVIGYGIYDPYTAKMQGPRADPPEVLDQLASVAPGRRSGFLPAMPRTTGQLRFYLRHNLRQVRLQTRVLETLLWKTQWDFFFGGYSEAHEGGHLLWHLGDPSSVEHPPGIDAELRDGMKNIYRAIDEGLDSILSRRPADATVMIVTPHGMGPHYRIHGAMDRILERGGWLRRRSDAGPGAYGRVRAKALAAARRWTPLRLRWATGRLRARTRYATPRYLSGIDWSTTRAFPLPQDAVSLVRLNLQGREPRGIVSKEAGDALIHDIRTELEQLQDESTGDPLLHDALVVEDLIGRPVGDVLPDLVARWRPISPRTIRSAGLGTIEVPTGDPRTGDHRPEGFMVAIGPSARAAENPGLTGPPADLVDVAPTVLALLGVAAPGELPGTPISVVTSGVTSA